MLVDILTKKIIQDFDDFFEAELVAMKIKYTSKIPSQVSSLLLEGYDFGYDQEKKNSEISELRNRQDEIANFFKIHLEQPNHAVSQGVDDFFTSTEGALESHPIEDDYVDVGEDPYAAFYEHNGGYIAEGYFQNLEFAQQQP